MTTPAAATSTVLAVRQQLVERFTGYLDAAGIDECPVFRGHPGQVVPLRHVAVGTTTEGGTRRQTRRLPFGLGAVGEEYDLEVGIWQETPGSYDVDAQAACTDMVWAIAHTLDAGLRSEISEYRLETDGVALVTAIYFTGFDDDEFLLEEGRAAEIVATLHVLSARH